MPQDPYLTEALSQVTPNGDNVTPALTFALEQALVADDPAKVYDGQLIRLAAALPEAERELALNRLRNKYGKDCNKTIWRRLVREAKAQLSTPAVSALILSENGSPKSILANAVIQLRSSGIELAYDTFSARIHIKKASPWGTEGPWSDRDDLECANYLQHKKVLVSSATAHEAADLLAYQAAFHPVRDWLTGLRWDGTPRLDRWMIACLGSEDTDYMRAVCAKWTISAVARIMRPGCKADHMIVLEGSQGKRKSMALRALVNGHTDGDRGVQWFRDSMPDIDGDDIGLYMRAVWVIEIAELEAIRGKQWTRVKAFISSQTDTFRRKFGRNMQEYPRQCVFAASTNEQHWSGDTTGARRFWPVRVEKVLIDQILSHREQILAEARFRYDEGSTWWLDDISESLAVTEQQQRAPDDAWVERIAGKVSLMSETSISEVLEKLAERADSANMQRAGRVLQSLGWERYRSTAEGRPWRYRRPE